MKFHRVYIEVTNICGLACSFCPPKAQPPQTMALSFFESVLNELHPYTKEIALHVMGDPMVLSNLNEYLDIAYRQGFRVMITTSGFYLDELRREICFHPAVKQINISLNSFNKNSVSKTFEEYLEPILALCDDKVSRNGEFFINLRLWNLDDVHSEKGFNGQLFQKLEKHFALDAGSLCGMISGERQSIRLASKVLLHFDHYFEWPSLYHDVVGNGYCHGLNGQIGILSDGRVVPCCLDSEGIIELGNLHVTNLGKILTSKRSHAIVQGFSKGLAVEELCQKCSYKERFNPKEQL